MSLGLSKIVGSFIETLESRQLLSTPISARTDARKVRSRAKAGLRLAAVDALEPRNQRPGFSKKIPAFFFVDPAAGSLRLKCSSTWRTNYPS